TPHAPVRNQFPLYTRLVGAVRALGSAVTDLARKARCYWRALQVASVRLTRECRSVLMSLAGTGRRRRAVMYACSVHGRRAVVSRLARLPVELRRLGGGAG